MLLRDGICPPVAGPRPRHRRGPLAAPGQLGHPDEVIPLRYIRSRRASWVAPLAALLSIVLVLAGAPRLHGHAHADAAKPHGHEAAHADRDHHERAPSDAVESASSATEGDGTPPADGDFHLHDATSLAAFVVIEPSHHAPAPPAAGPPVIPQYAPDRSAAAPPQRPPIA